MIGEKMAGGKVHGQGGHGRFSTEIRRKYAHEEEAKAKIARAQEKRSRLIDKKFDRVQQYLSQELSPIITNVSKRIDEAFKRGKLRPVPALVRMLALDAWNFEMAKRRASEEGILHLVNLEELHVLSKEKREAHWAKLTNKHTTNNGRTFGKKEYAELREEIEKWKGRVPKMAKGEYL